MQMPIFGGIALFAFVLFIYAFDFLIDIQYWESKGIGHYKLFKLLAKIWMGVSAAIVLSLIVFLIYSGEVKNILVGNEIGGFLNYYSAILVVFIGIYVLLKITKVSISGLYFLLIIALVSAMSICAPIFLLAKLPRFTWQSDLFNPLIGYFCVFLANVLTVSYYEKEKDIEGNTRNIWNTNEKLANYLMYIIPVTMMVFYWIFKWNVNMHPMYFTLAFYMIMFYFPKVFRIASAYRIIADLTLLLMFMKIQW